MTSPPPAKPDLASDLSDAEFQALQVYAKANGLTADQAATRAVQQLMRSHFVRPKRQARILRFPK